MTSQAPVASPRAPLLDLLEREFEADSMRQLLGDIAGLVPEKLWSEALRDPLQEGLGRRGKEFRARLVSLSYGLAGGQPPMPSEISALLELLHAGSLIIDDIEDDSETRRGLPSLHVAHGTPVALNAGNWIYFWAFKLVEHLPLGEAQQLSLVRHMSRALLACHFGQALDLSVAVDQLPRPQVLPLVRATTGLKTGRLMQLGAEVGAVAAGADEACREALADFGSRVGVGLQMLDDLGGLTSERRRHKGFEDLRLGRLTWPWAWAAELESDVSYTRLRDLARDVRSGRAPAERLVARLRESVGTSGRRRIHEHLADALAALDAKLGPAGLGPAELLADLRQETARLEESYE